MDARRFGITLALALGCCFFLTTFQVRAQSEIFRQTWGKEEDPSTVIVSSVFMFAPPAGMAPIQISVTNKTDASVGFSLRGESSVPAREASMSRGGAGQAHTYRSDFSVTAPANKTTLFNLLVPVLPDYSVLVPAGGYGTSQRGRLRLVLDGPAAGTGDLRTMGLQGHLTVAISAKLLPVAYDIRKLGASGDYFACSFAAGTLPEDWRGYSGLECVLLTTEEWGALSPGQRTALQQWVRLGGILSLFSTRAEFTAAGFAPENPRHGLGFIQWQEHGGTPLEPGQITTYSSSGSGGNQVKIHDFTHLGGNLMMLPDPEKSAATWEVGFILLIFGILVGPVNLFYFARSGRRHKLFVTTPLLSLGAAVVLLCFIFFQDGSGARGTRFAVIYVDAAESAGYIMQQQTSRSGVLFGSTLKAPDALIGPAVLPESDLTRLKPFRSTGTGNPQSYRSSGAPDYAGDWWQSRSEQAQLLQFVAPMRGRLEAIPSPSTSAPVFTSTFAAPLDWLFYLDSQGNWWRSPSAVTTGARVTLIKCTQADFAKQQVLLYQASKALQDRIFGHMEKGFFYALSRDGKALGLQQTLDSVRWDKEEIYLFGPVATSP